VITSAGKVRSVKELRQVVLSDEEKESLLSSLGRVGSNLLENVEDFLVESHDAMRQALPSHIFNAVVSLRRETNSQGVLLIKNLPIGSDLGPTPNDQNPVPFLKKSNISESCLVGIGQILGEIFSYKNERNGSLVHNIYPRKSQREVISSEGSEVPLPLHIEDVHLFPYYPIFICFLCLRSELDKEVYTYVLEAKDIVSSLDENTLQILESPLFYSEPPEVFRGQSRNSELMPVFQGPRSQPQITLELNDTRAVSPEGKRALDILKEVCSQSSKLILVNLQPGDLLILDNRKVLHGRGAFNSDFCENSRWCQRVLIKSGDLWDWRDKFIRNRVLNL